MEFEGRWNGIGADGASRSGNGPKIPERQYRDFFKCRRERPKIGGGHPEENTHGIVVYGELRYCTMFDEIYVSQFFFGLNTLWEFESEEPIVIDEIQGDSGPIQMRRIEEIPQKFSRFPVNMKMYKKVES